MSKYILDSRYYLRGWYGAKTGVYDTKTREAHFVEPSFYQLLAKCDAVHEIDENGLSEAEKHFLRKMKEEHIIRPAGRWDFMLPRQQYYAYPARYRKHVHWSITGGCNLRCRHCFMSAPHARHGVADYQELLAVADQLAECGVFSADITGGEPLMRGDFLNLVEALNQRDIGISTIYTNGWLLDEKLLDALEAKGVQPSFQLSFDGVGRHDFLRGVSGAEERTISALKLLQERKYQTAVSMCLHRENARTLRETVLLLASLGVRNLKCGSMMELGEWADPAVKELRLSQQEELEIFERYIPQYFEDDAPLSLMLSGAFIYEKGSGRWDVFYRRVCPREKEWDQLACPVLGEAFYIGADGAVAPCQGMCDSGLAGHLPNLKEQPLRDLLKDSAYVRYSYATVGDVRDGNEECRRCEFTDRCAGGCRQTALTGSGSYLGVDPEACYYFRNGWEERIRAAAEQPFRAYLKRNPPGQKQ